MAVAAFVESAKGTGVSGKYGDSFTFTRKWLVRVDNPATSRVLIANAPGVKFGDGYPGFASHRAMEFDLTEESGDGMMWLLVVRYYVPPVENTPDDSTGMPKDCWAASGSTTTIPAYVDKDGVLVTNSAGDPLEGSEREASEFALTLTKCYQDLSWSPIAKSHSNTVNSSSWNGSNARTWKAEFKSAHKKEMTVSGSESSTKAYWEVSWEFRYREETWDYKPWDVGFNELADGGRVAILGKDKKPVKQPVALSNGVAKSPGSKPDKLTFTLYPEADFSVFGTPG